MSLKAGRRAEQAGDNDAAKEEQPQRDVAAPQREGEAGGEEAVVEPLIGGERRARFGEVRQWCGTSSGRAAAVQANISRPRKPKCSSATRSGQDVG